MLGACSKADDIPLLEEMIKSKDRQTKGALDALVAAYLTLKGPDGMPLVEELFLKDQDAEYTDTYATIMALRFHGTEEKIIPRKRLLDGMRLMLDRPQLADLVIPDLARWEDWSVMDRLVELFKTSDEESSWVRVPVINYLRACPLPEAQAQDRRAGQNRSGQRSSGPTRSSRWGRPQRHPRRPTVTSRTPPRRKQTRSQRQPRRKPMPRRPPARRRRKPPKVTSRRPPPPRSRPPDRKRATAPCSSLRASRQPCWPGTWRATRPPRRNRRWPRCRSLAEWPRPPYCWRAPSGPFSRADSIPQVDRGHRV